MLRADEGVRVKPQGPPLTEDEVAARARRDTLLDERPAFLRYALTQLAAQRRVVELLAWPPRLHERVAEFLASVRGIPCILPFSS